MYSVKNIKTWNSREYGPKGAFSCTLYRDNKKVANVTEWGNGGPPDIMWLDKQKTTRSYPTHDGGTFTCTVTVEEKAFYEFVEKQMYYSEFLGKETSWSVDGYVCKLVGEYETEKQLRRWCKTKIVAITKGCKKDQYATYSMPFTKENKEAILKKENDIIEFVNERFL